jgi:hypothetical protein
MGHKPSATSAYYPRKDADVYTKVLRSARTDCNVPIMDYFSLGAFRELGGVLIEDGLHDNPSIRSPMPAALYH